MRHTCGKKEPTLIGFLLASAYDIYALKHEINKFNNSLKLAVFVCDRIKETVDIVREREIKVEECMEGVERTGKWKM